MTGEVVSMETRLAVAMARRLGGVVTVTELAGELGVSRQTFYVYRRRFDAEGLAGLVPRSRAPHRQPNRTAVGVEDEVVRRHKELRELGLDCGARSVWGWMVRAGGRPPSARTVHRILVRRGLVSPQPQKAPRRKTRRFAAAQPNGCWQIDGMDWWLADGTPVKVIRVLDDCSRRVFRSVVAGSESGAAAWECMERAMAEFGAPAMLLSDNSLAFNGSRRNVEVDLQRRLRQLGVAQVAASPQHPGTCGKAEREHQTLQRWLRARLPARTIADLQRLIDDYDEVYNSRRPHQALGGVRTPQEAYEAAPKARAADRPLPEPAARLRQAKVSDKGVVSAGNVEVHIGREWAQAQVQVARSGNHVAVFHQGRLIHATAIDPRRRYQPSGRPAGRPRGGRPLPRIIAGNTAANTAAATRSQDAAPAAKRGRTTLTPRREGGQSPAPPPA